MKPRNLPDPVTAALFDFDETMIDLESQHDAAHRRLCRAMGSDYDEMPESFRFGSGRRIVDDIRDMRAHFGWSESPDVLYEIRHRAFLDECRRASLELMSGVERTVRRTARPRPAAGRHVQCSGRRHRRDPASLRHSGSLRDDRRRQRGQSRQARSRGLLSDRSKARRRSGALPRLRGLRGGSAGGEGRRHVLLCGAESAGAHCSGSRRRGRNPAVARRARRR